MSKQLISWLEDQRRSQFGSYPTEAEVLAQPQQPQTAAEVFADLQARKDRLSKLPLGARPATAADVFAQLQAKKEANEGVYRSLPGTVQPGNIDLFTRPNIANSDGSHSSIRSTSFTNDDGTAILIPTISDEGTRMLSHEALNYWRKKGKHLGIYKDIAAAEAASQALHQQQAELLKPAEEPKPANAKEAFEQMREKARTKGRNFVEAIPDVPTHLIGGLRDILEPVRQALQASGQFDVNAQQFFAQYDKSSQKIDAELERIGQRTSTFGATALDMASGLAPIVAEMWSGEGLIKNMAAAAEKVPLLGKAMPKVMRYLGAATGQTATRLPFIGAAAARRGDSADEFIGKELPQEAGMNLVLATGGKEGRPFLLKGLERASVPVKMEAANIANKVLFSGGTGRQDETDTFLNRTIDALKEAPASIAGTAAGLALFEGGTAGLSRAIRMIASMRGKPAKAVGDFMENPTRSNLKRAGYDGESNEAERVQAAEAMRQQWARNNPDTAGYEFPAADLTPAELAAMEGGAAPQQAGPLNMGKFQIEVADRKADVPAAAVNPGATVENVPPGAAVQGPIRDLLSQEVLEPIGSSQRDLAFERNQAGRVVTDNGVLTEDGKLASDTGQGTVVFGEQGQSGAPVDAAAPEAAKPAGPAGPPVAPPVAPEPSAAPKAVRPKNAGVVRVSKPERAVRAAGKVIDGIRKKFGYRDNITHDHAYVKLLKQAYPMSGEVPPSAHVRTAAQNALYEHRKAHGYKDTLPYNDGYMNAIGAYHEAAMAHVAERAVATKKANQKNAGVIRKQAKADVVEGNVTPEAVRTLPLHELPDDLRMAIQAEAAAQMETSKSAKTKAALQRIIDDGDRDTGAAVRYQKGRILGVLTGDIDQRSIWERGQKNRFGFTKGTITEARPVDPIVDLYVTRKYEEGKGNVLVARTMEERVAILKEAIASIESGRPNELAQAAYSKVDGGIGESWKFVGPDVVDFLRTMGTKRATGEAELGGDQGASPRPVTPGERPPETGVTPKGKGMLGTLTEVERVEMDAIKARIMGKLGGELRSGIDPTVLVDIAQLGGYYAKAGIRTVKAFVKQLFADIPPEAHPNIHPDDIRWAYKKVARESKDKAGFEDIDSLRDADLMKMAGMGGNEKPSTADTPAQRTPPTAQGSARSAREPTDPVEERLDPPAHFALTRDHQKKVRDLMKMPGLPSLEREAWEEVQQEARQRGFNSPETAKGIALRYNMDGNPISRPEKAGLQEVVVDLTLQHEAIQERAEAGGPDAMRGSLGDLLRIEDDINLLTSVIDRNGTDAGRTLNFQRYTLDREASIVHIKRRAKIMAGRELTAEETAKLESLVKQRKADQQQIMEQEHAIQRLVAEQMVKVGNKYKGLPIEDLRAMRMSAAERFLELAKNGCV